MSQYGMYGNRQNEFGYLAEGNQRKIIEHCHAIANLMNEARDVVSNEVTRREAWRENAADRAGLSIGDVTRVMIFAKSGHVGILLARLDGRYSTDGEFPVLWPHDDSTEWLTVDDVEAIASLSDPATKIDVRTGCVLR